MKSLQASIQVRRPRIGLMGMYISRNLGDVAIQIAVMRATQKRRPNIEFVGLCQDPEDTARSFGIPAFASSGYSSLMMPGQNGPVALGRPLTGDSRLSRVICRVKAIWRIYRQMRDLDMLLISGSGQVDDFWGGPWAQPFRLFVWSAVARLQRKPVAVFGVGVDEVNTRLGAWLSVRALRLAHQRVLRDSGSLVALRAMGLGLPTEVCPDPAFHLAGGTAREASTTSFAVISPISRRAWPGKEDADYDAYLGALAAVGDELLRQSVQVRFICSHTRMDPPIIDRVKARMLMRGAGTRVVEVATVDAYLDAVRNACILVGSRLHAIILAFVAGTPVIAVSAVRKVHQQLQDIGLTEYAFKMRDIDVPLLLQRVNEVLQNREQLRNHIAERTADFRRQLDEQFDRVCRLVPDSSSKSVTLSDRGIRSN